MRGKKVCILASVHSPFDTRIFHKQAKSLVKAGYDVTLITKHDKDEIVDGVKIVALPKAKNRFRRMLGTWRAFRLAVRQKADIYHFHDPELLPWGWLLQELTHKTMVTICTSTAYPPVYFAERKRPQSGGLSLPIYHEIGDTET